MKTQNFTRREMSRTLATAGFATVVGAPLVGQIERVDHAPGRSQILRYLEQLARADGGFGFEGQERSHLTATLAVIACWRLLDAMPTDLKPLAEFVRTHHPRALKVLVQDRRIFEFQQAQALVWLGDPATELRVHLQTLSAPSHYGKVFERNGYPMFQSEVGIAQAYALLGLSFAAWRPAFQEYVLSRRRANGSFNNAPASDGGDGHVMNTLWGLQALRLLELPITQKAETADWLRRCQLPSGGFTFQPKPELGGVDDVAYTRAAVRALQILGEKPRDVAGCRAWLQSLATADGGFSDRPGWASNAPATYCVLDALTALAAIGDVEKVRRPAAPRRRPLPEGLKVFSLQVEAHGTGSPADVVNLAAALRIQLWGCKAPNPKRMARARVLAQVRGIPLGFFPADEEYDTWLNFPGVGTYSHVTDTIVPPAGNAGASLSGSTAISWSEFRERRIVPLRRGGGHLIWQFNENEELTRMLLDDSVECGGYAAISTYHYNNPDFTNSEPFLYRWQGQIPYVALQDAHGSEAWWWSEMTTGFRTLFLAEAPTWDGWQQALKEGWVVAVRHDEISRNETWMHTGSAEVREFVRARESQWRWWSNPDVFRPLVSLVALTSEDLFEVGRPENGVNLRVRCAWTNNAGGVPITPLAELVRLEVDGQTVAPKLVEKKRAKGDGWCDVYHLWEGPALSEGEHRAEAWVREISSGREEKNQVTFVV